MKIAGLEADLTSLRAKYEKLKAEKNLRDQKERESKATEKKV